MSVYVCVCVMRWPTASGQTLRPLGQATPTSATSVVLLSVGHRYRAGNDQGLDVVASIDGVFQSLFFPVGVPASRLPGPFVGLPFDFCGGGCSRKPRHFPRFTDCYLVFNVLFSLSLSLSLFQPCGVDNPTVVVVAVFRRRLLLRLLLGLSSKKNEIFSRRRGLERGPRAHIFLDWTPI